MENVLVYETTATFVIRCKILETVIDDCWMAPCVIEFKELFLKEEVFQAMKKHSMC